MFYVDKFASFLAEFFRPYKDLILNYIYNIGYHNYANEACSSLLIINSYIYFLYSLVIVFMMFVVIFIIKKSSYQSLLSDKVNVSRLTINYFVNAILVIAVLVMIVISVYIYNILFLSKNLSLIYNDYLLNMVDDKSITTVTIDFQFYLLNASETITIIGYALASILGYYRSFFVVKNKK